MGAVSDEGKGHERQRNIASESNLSGPLPRPVHAACRLRCCHIICGGLHGRDTPEAVLPLVLPVCF